MIISLHIKGYTESEISQKLNINVSSGPRRNRALLCTYCFSQVNLVNQWIQLYEGQRSRNNVIANDEVEISNEKKDILTETVNGSIDIHSRNDTITSNLIEIVEYVSILFKE